MTEKQGGSFPVGFALGLFAGAVGYLLKTSPDGEEVRSFLQKEWSKAHEQLKTQHGYKGSVSQLNQVLSELFSYYAPPIQHSSSEKKSLPLSSKKQTTEAKTKKSTHHFRGV